VPDPPLPGPAPRGPRRALRADAERNRRLVLDAAVEVFAERGLDAGVAEVARRAGVGSATVFRRFPTKEDLILAVIEERVEEFRRIAEEGLADPDPWRGLVRLMEAFSQVQARDRGLVEAAATSLTGDPRLHELHHRVLDLLERVVARAHDAGVLRLDVTAEDLPLLASGVAGACMTAGDVVPDLWRRYLGVVLDGLRPAAATPLSRPAPTLDQIMEAKARGAGPAPSEQQLPLGTPS
jgi:AcrR family transcriptional regulator